MKKTLFYAILATGLVVLTFFECGKPKQAKAKPQQVKAKPQQTERKTSAPVDPISELLDSPEGIRVKLAPDRSISSFWAVANVPLRTEGSVAKELKSKPENEEIFLPQPDFHHELQGMLHALRDLSQFLNTNISEEKPKDEVRRKSSLVFGRLRLKWDESSSQNLNERTGIYRTTDTENIQLFQGDELLYFLKSETYIEQQPKKDTESATFKLRLFQGKELLYSEDETGYGVGDQPARTTSKYYLSKEKNDIRKFYSLLESNGYGLIFRLLRCSVKDGMVRMVFSIKLPEKPVKTQKKADASKLNMGEFLKALVNSPSGVYRLKTADGEIKSFIVTGFGKIQPGKSSEDARKKAMRDAALEARAAAARFINSHVRWRENKNGELSAEYIIDGNVGKAETAAEKRQQEALTQAALGCLVMLGNYSDSEKYLIAYGLNIEKFKATVQAVRAKKTE